MPDSKVRPAGSTKNGRILVGKSGPNDMDFISPVALGDMDRNRTQGVDAAFNYLEKTANPGTSFGGIVLAAVSFVMGIASGGFVAWATKLGC